MPVQSSFKHFMLRMLLLGSRVLGGWFLRSVAYAVTAGYFVFRPKQVGASMSLYRAIFPGRSRVYYLGCAWRQFADFTAAYCDRLILDTGGSMSTVEEGWEHLEARIQQGLGGIMVVSHVGNVEIAARMFRRKGLKMMLFAAERDPKAVARQQVADMTSEGLEVRVASAGETIPSVGLEALQFLENGGFVATSGDLSWADPHRRVRVRMFDREVLLPGTAHYLALITRQPLFSFYAIRIGPGRYRYRVSEPRWVGPAKGPRRREVVRQSVQSYARELESVIREFPWQWHVFEPLLGRDTKAQHGDRT
jgi:lauroyl/myristoyl acyltransferase